MENSLVPPATLDAPDLSPSPLPGSGDDISNSSGEPGGTAVEAGPHGALFLVLGYLRLPELFAFQRVCRLFRDAIAGDCLLWRHIIVEPPLSGRLTDDALVRVTSRAGGKLASLALLKCWKITDAGLLRAVEQNPTITKLYVPGCTYLTADGVVRVVKQLSEQKGHLKCLRLHGVFDITGHHLDLLSSFLGENDPRSGPQPSFYNYQHTFPLDIDDGRPIDVDVCPKCKNVRLVFDCTRENCRSMKSRWTQCRGCFFCIARCEECGGCIDFEEVGETACSDLLCLECWLQLPKCNTCNRPYCKCHLSLQEPMSEPNGFVCEQCRNCETSSS